MRAEIDKATRWGKHLDLLDGLIVDNWGIMTLDGQRHINRHPLDTSLPVPSPSWEMPESVTDAIPDVTRVPDGSYGVNYITPRPLPPPIHLTPSKTIEPMAHRLALWPYVFKYRGGHARILAAFSSEINTWWIGRISVTDR